MNKIYRNKRNISKIKFFFIFFIFLISFFISIDNVEGATRTWRGITNGSWADNSNWEEDITPVTGDDLVFPSGASNLSNTNDLTPNTIFNSITISGSGYTLSGNSIILGAGLAGITDSASSGGNTIAFDIRLDATRDIIVTNSVESLTISGAITGAGGINKEGLGKLILSGGNTFGGILKINVGIVNARNDRALGTILGGTEIVGNAALELQGNIDISYEALALRGYGVSEGGALRNISGNNTFRGLITLSQASGAEIASDSGTLTLTGGTTGHFPLFLDGEGNITFSTAPLTGVGAITKNGAGTVALNFPNTNTGAITINAGTILYGVDNALMTNTIYVTGGTLDISSYSDHVGTVILGTLDLASGTITGTTGVLSSATWTVYNGTISAIIAGVAGTLTKNSTGTVTLTRDNLYTGATTVSTGILKIQSNNALGVIDGITTISSGATLQIDGDNLSIPEYITFSGVGLLYKGAIYNTTGNNTLNGLLTLGAGSMIRTDVNTTLTIHQKGLFAGSSILTIAGEGNTIFNSTAPIYGTSATLIKDDIGTLTIQSFSNFTGNTTINRGLLVLSGKGAIPLSTIYINSGGTLSLDNSTTSILNRISDSSSLIMRGGAFNFIGSSSSSTQELAGTLTLSEGHNTITITPGAGGSTTMTFASLSRPAGVTALFRGTNFGSTPSSNVSTLMFTSAPTLTGAGGVSGTTTMSIIKGAFGDNSLSGEGSDMVTYNVGNINGLRLLNGAGFSGEYAGDLSTAYANVKLTADRVAIATNTNSLILNGYGITNPGSNVTIPIASASLAGNILINSANNIAGANTTLGILNYELPILATANSTISATIGTVTTGRLTLSGTGNVILSASNPYTERTCINGGTLTYGANNIFSSGGVEVIGGTLDIGNYTDTVGAVVLQNGTITGESGVLTATSYNLREGIVSAIIAGSGTTTRVATNTQVDSVVTLTRDNTYTGDTTITSGILKLGSAGNGTNTPFGTTAGGTTIASGGALDLNGYTLSTGEAITSMAGNGFGDSSASVMGALMNSSSTSVSYSGDITLGSASRINADYGAITLSSNISGNYALTFGGFSDINYSGVRSGTSTIVKEGIGTLTLSGNSSYSGVTTINTGTLKLGATGDTTNTPLGTTAGATSITAGARLDLNGYTLGTAEPLTLNGEGYGIGNGASGSLMNSSLSAVTYSGLITLAGATIKADYGDINLTNTGTITGSGMALTLGGSGNGTLASLIGTGTGAVTKIGTGTWILSNSGSTYTGTTHINLGTLKLGASGGGTYTPLGTTGGGTVIYSGAVLDLAGYTLGTAEALTINGRGINDSGALINSGGSATFEGAITQGSDSRISNNGSGTLALTSATTVAGAFALYIGGSNNITTKVLGMSSGSLVKQGAGTVTATGNHTYTGTTRIDQGTFAYGSGATLLAGTNLAVVGGAFDMGGVIDTIGTVTLIDGTISNGFLFATTSYTLEKGTISAVLSGAIAVSKNTNNTVTLTGANTISSTTTINAGNLILSGNGTAVSTTITINLGGTLTLDNTNTAVASRLGDALALTLNGGNFNFIGNSSGASSETTGALTLSTGHNVITITPGSGGSTTMTFASLSRSTGATVLFRGTDFGSTPSSNVSTLMFNSTPTRTGAGGSANSNTISIIKGAFGDSSLSGNGSDMVTYNVGNTNGLRLLNGAGFSGEYAGDLSTANANVKLTANRTAVATNTNSLILNGYSITNPLSAVTIPIAGASLAGNILINSATNIEGLNTTLGITTFELPILTTVNSTISATIGTATGGAFTLSGNGNVTLYAVNPYTGTTRINGATLTYGRDDVIASGEVNVVGGIYYLNNYSDTIGALSINAGTVATGSGTLTLGGTVTTIANNNASSSITGNLNLGANRIFNIGNGLVDNDAIISALIDGAYNITKSTYNGLLMLSGNNTYTGSTTVSAGTLRLGSAGNGTYTPLGTTDGDTIISGSTSSVFDLNGYTLGTAEALTLSGALATGALQNTSSTSATYSGLITLGANSTIISNYGDINITNTGNITGTYNLTIGGAGNGTLASNLNITTGTLTKNNIGTWTISGGASTYTGLTTISAGTLKLGSAGSGSNTPLGTSAGGVTVTSGAIFDLNGYTLATAEPIGSLSGTGIANMGALINSSNNSVTYSGAITLVAASRVVNHGSGTMTLSGNISGNYALTFVTVGNITQFLSSVWSGSGTLTKEGSGTLILGGQNSMTGAMTVSTGILQLGADGGPTNTPLGTNVGGVTVALGAVLDLSSYSLGGASTYETLNLSGTGIGNGGALISSASGNNNFGATTITASSLVKNSGIGAIIFSGYITVGGSINLNISGTGPTTISIGYGVSGTTATLTKNDSGILTISAMGPTIGLFRINGGTLKYGIANAISTGPVTVAGGTLDLSGYSDAVGSVTLIDGSIIDSVGGGVLTSTATYVLEKGTISAKLGSAVSSGIAKNTGGRVILSGDNTFTSTTIAVNAGYLNLQHSNALGAVGTSLTATVSGGATLELQGGITLPATKTLTVHGMGMENNGAIRNVSGTNVISTNIALPSTNVRINSDSGSLTIPAISGNTYNVIFGGTEGDITVSGVLGTTTGTVIKDGTSTATLSGTNTYTGLTIILGGSIVANTLDSLGGSNNTLIFNGGTLKLVDSLTFTSSRPVILNYGGGTIDTNGNNVSIESLTGNAGGLTKSGLGTLTLTGATTIGRDLTISAGTFVAPTSLTINGNFSNSGTYTHSNGTLTLAPNNGTLTSNILGTADTTFYNFTNTTAGSTLNFKAGNTYTFTNLLTLTGVDNNKININSDTPDSQWYMTLDGSSSVDFLIVKDSGCNDGNDIPVNLNLSDMGNNGSCWFRIISRGGGGGNVEPSAEPDPDVGGGEGDEGGGEDGAGGEEEGEGEDQGDGEGDIGGGDEGGDLGFLDGSRFIASVSSFYIPNYIFFNSLFLLILFLIFKKKII